MNSSEFICNNAFSLAPPLVLGSKNRWMDAATALFAHRAIGVTDQHLLHRNRRRIAPVAGAFCFQVGRWYTFELRTNACRGERLCVCVICACGVCVCIDGYVYERDRVCVSVHAYMFVDEGEKWPINVCVYV